MYRFIACIFRPNAYRIVFAVIKHVIFNQNIRAIAAFVPTASIIGYMNRRHIAFVENAIFDNNRFACSYKYSSCRHIICFKIVHNKRRCPSCIFYHAPYFNYAVIRNIAKLDFGNSWANLIALLNFCTANR